MNFAEHIFRFYRDIGEPNSNRFPIDLLKMWFDEAEEMLNRESRQIYASLGSQSLVAGQEEYTLPTNILENEVLDVLFAAGDYTERVPLIPSTLEFLRTGGRMVHETDGEPTHFYINPVTGKLGFWPKPDSNYTEKVEILYIAKHTPMTRYYATGTVAISNGSTSLVGTDTAFEGNVAAGDEIGVGALFGGTFPREYYVIDSVDSDTGLTLEAAYAGATETAGALVASSVSSFPDDELCYASITYVKGMAKLKDGAVEYGSALRQEAVSRAKRIYRKRERVAMSELPVRYLGRSLSRETTSEGYDYVSR